MQIRAGEIITVLHHIQVEGFSCIVEFESIDNSAVSQRQTPSTIFKCSLIFQSGVLTYAGRKVPSPLEFVRWVGHKMQFAHMESTLQMVTSRVKNPNSVRELIEFITRFGLIKWPDLENLMHREAAVFLEQAQLCPGVLQKKMNSSFDLSYGENRHGLNLALIQQILDKRKQLWRSLAPEIVLDTVLCPQPDKASLLPPQILPHFSRWITGQFKLSEIAWGCGEDPLNLAQTYLKWSRQDWLILKNTSRSANILSSSVTTTRPIILSVDDSKIVQTITAQKIVTKVLPNNRIEVQIPSVSEGQEVTVFIALPTEASSATLSHTGLLSQMAQDPEIQSELAAINHLKQTMNSISDEATANGLTPEILESILND
jgi:hypothetical protein